VKPKRINQLQFPRFIAALIVIFFHYGKRVYPLNQYPLNMVLLRGPLMVDFFFVLSGFILTYAYYSEKPIVKRQFWVARISRIYPVYLLAILFFSIVRIQTAGLKFDLIGFFINFFVLQSWVHPYTKSIYTALWAISNLAFYYMVFPFLIDLLKKIGERKFITLVVVWWISTQIFVHLIYNLYHQPNSFSHTLIFNNPMVRINSFLIGMTGGILFQKRQREYPKNKVISSLLFWGLVCIFIVLLVYRREIQQFMGFKIVYEPGLFAFIFLGLIILLAIDRTMISKILNLKPLVYLGNASLSIYIMQGPIFYLYNNLIVNQFWENSMVIGPTKQFYIYVIVEILISILIFQLFEITVAKKIGDYFLVRSSKK